MFLSEKEGHAGRPDLHWRAPHFFSRGVLHGRVRYAVSFGGKAKCLLFMLPNAIVIAKFSLIYARLLSSGTLLPNTRLDLAMNQLLSAIVAEPVTVPASIESCAHALAAELARRESLTSGSLNP